MGSPLWAPADWPCRCLVPRLLLLLLPLLRRRALQSQAHAVACPSQLNGLVWIVCLHGIRRTV